MSMPSVAFETEAFIMIKKEQQSLEKMDEYSFEINLI